jgi:hypothetical protein
MEWMIDELWNGRKPNYGMDASRTMEWMKDEIGNRRWTKALIAPEPEPSQEGSRWGHCPAAPLGVLLHLCVRTSGPAGPALGTTTLPRRRQWRFYLLQSRAWPRSESAQPGPAPSLRSLAPLRVCAAWPRSESAQPGPAPSLRSLLNHSRPWASGEENRRGVIRVGPGDSDEDGGESPGIPSRSGCPSLVRVSSESNSRPSLVRV